MNAFDTSVISSIIFGLIYITVSAFFAAAETAISVGLSPAKVEGLINQRRGLNNRHLELWLAHPGRVLTTILVFNNVFKIAAVAQVTLLVSKFADAEIFIVAVAVTAFTILLVGEIIPKALARAYYDKISVSCLYVVHVLYQVFKPVVYVFVELANALLRLMGIEGKSKPVMTADEMEHMISEGEKAGIIEDTKKEMLSGVFEFDATKVREIMTPRTDMIALPRQASIKEALEMIIESGHSRLPVYEERIDNIVGILFAKDMLRHLHLHDEAEARLGTIEPLMREPFFVPESNQLMEVFKELKRTKIHLAVIIDEYGGTAGIVTMEDILEEIVGEIQDEYDSEEAELIKLDAITFDISGSMNISDFVEHFGLDDGFENEVESEVDTIAGWITKLLGDLPEIGQTVSYGNLTMEVTKISRHRIDRIRVVRNENPT